MDGVINFALMVIVLVMVFYAMIFRFHVIPFIGAIVFVLAILKVYPELLEKSKENPMFIYYSMFLTITILLASEFCKSLRGFLILLITNVFVCLLALIYPHRFFLILSYFLNFYIVLRILTIYIYEEDCEVI